jgi:hypothetical protein
VLLYSFVHNNTYETPTWKQHHETFSRFVLDNIEKTSLLEIGGASGYLAQKLLAEEKNIQISILDLAKQPEFKIPIKYIEANCETFDFTQIAPSTPIVLSHVFEHLYNPRKFLTNVKKANIKKLILSVPTMEVCLSKKFLSFLHVEHTYYCSTEHIMRMMAEAGFACSSKQSFREHSTFFCFDKKESIEVTPYADPDILIRQFREYYSERDTLYKSIVLEKNTYIVPAGHYGQLIYFLLESQKDKILGFLDNDNSKVGKRMYGTDKYIYPMNILKTHQDTTICVLLNAGPYIKEIKHQMIQYNPTVEFLCI